MDSSGCISINLMSSIKCLLYYIILYHVDYIILLLYYNYEYMHVSLHAEYLFFFFCPTYTKLKSTECLTEANH